MAQTSSCSECETEVRSSADVVVQVVVCDGLVDHLKVAYAEQVGGDLVTGIGCSNPETVVIFQRPTIDSLTDL